MDPIRVEHLPCVDHLRQMGVDRWPIWTKEVSEFPWEYDEPETCLFLEGEVVVTPEGGTPVTVRAGDLVTFPQGMKCTWKVIRPVRKHYRFGQPAGER
ncbi:MAG TPA: cupin domain-containing protein [Myxococcota bacterium]|jgi:uncharacterized cupin superfamily protein|nr:cupin domain-containing protein [Myxococcota bacterium]